MVSPTESSEYPALRRVLTSDAMGNGMLSALVRDGVPLEYAERLAETAFDHSVVSHAARWSEDLTRTVRVHGPRWYLGTEFLRIATEYYREGIAPEDFHPAVPASLVSGIKELGYSVRLVGEVAGPWHGRYASVARANIGLSLVMPPVYSELALGMNFSIEMIAEMYQAGYRDPEGDFERGRLYISHLSELFKNGFDPVDTMACSRSFHPNLWFSALCLDVTADLIPDIIALGEGAPRTEEELRIRVAMLRHGLPREFAKAMVS